MRMLIIICNVGGAPAALLILAEEELVAVDLMGETWPTIEAPCLNAIHASAVTCLSHVDATSPEVIQRLRENSPSSGQTSHLWPVTGGQTDTSVSGPSKSKSSTSGSGFSPTADLLVTGHEDGSVKIWDCSGVSLVPLATVKTNKFFIGDELDELPTRKTLLVLIENNRKINWLIG